MSLGCRWGVVRVRSRYGWLRHEGRGGRVQDGGRGFHWGKRDSAGEYGRMKGVPYVSKRLKKKCVTYPVNALGLASAAAEAAVSSRMWAADVLLWRCVVR